MAPSGGQEASGEAGEPRKMRGLPTPHPTRQPRPNLAPCPTPAPTIPTSTPCAGAGGGPQQCKGAVPAGAGAAPAGADRGGTGRPDAGGRGCYFIYFYLVSLHYFI